MRGPLELVVFVGLAAAAHAAVIAVVAGDAPGLPPGAGAGGESGITLAALPGLAGTVAEWDAAPEVSGPPRAPALVADVPVPEMPEAMAAVTAARHAAAVAEAAPPDEARPVLPERPAVPVAGMVAAPPMFALPEAGATVGRIAGADHIGKEPTPRVRLAALAPDTPDFAAPAPPRPIARLPERAGAAPPARPAFRARGAGGGAVSGHAPRPPAETDTARAAAAAPDPSLIARWGARIGARIEARKLAPRGNWAPGKAVLRLVVARDGTVTSVRLVQSAGDARLDRAAIQAVTRAGRMPAAPEGFAAPSATFTLPASFTR